MVFYRVVNARSRGQLGHELVGAAFVLLAVAASVILPVTVARADEPPASSGQPTQAPDRNDEGGATRARTEVRVQVSRRGVEVRLDDRSIGISPIGAPVELAPGQHTFSVLQEGRLVLEHVIHVAAGEHRELTLDVGPEPVRRQAPARRATREPRSRWYGGKTLVVDLVSLGLTPLFGVGLGGYVFGGPVVHLAVGHPWMALLSFGIRVTAPVSMACAWVLFSDCDDGWGCGIPALGLGFFGMLVAMAVDIAALSWHPPSVLSSPESS